MLTNDIQLCIFIFQGVRLAAENGKLLYMDFIIWKPIGSNKEHGCNTIVPTCAVEQDNHIPYMQKPAVDGVIESPIVSIDSEITCNIYCYVSVKSCNSQ